MERRFCNHCGRLYEGERCSCRRDKPPKTKSKVRENFYESKAWRKMSYNIRIRDFNMDRLQLYFNKYKPENRIEKMLFDYLIDSNGAGRNFTGRIIVHHIKEIESDWQNRLNEDNLISLNFHTHEYIHQLYFDFKEDVQALLFKAVNADLP